MSGNEYDATHSFEIDEKQAFRLESKWTDEETAHELLETLVDAGVKRDVLKVAERRLEVDPGR
ncbi:MAG: hypothetical protein ABEI57_03855 [Halapricum sp.]